ncbi:rRNA methyltransferase Rrp8 [Schizosaccharomyces pombe]|uniref:25S rRNA (adenine(645)-N(1))-methyltransferase n=1 Tax=Schizosaccharomyces pombe (strain 972 / ATCC 24843) TaxID=284812 RepID=RRP8_SCHPO|nr:putative rRNA methyltransferase Rrp8 [Schizosaccharomyces pombe]Q10257.1 RecName: Full=25S rRNA (adenine(645)-N(1))-methyltransferase; AltName: Full=Ribosomal RNA-processing protein 8 [Schizosaccharomyces pombe 972h-]CAA93580.1 rRNA methyltransferase Rrp8 (predicted) [Schizosaccharomyces pombe]|eukprot:NP_593223.1 putative rRNA methyltransferase Rrp8 [Schizosaccharomyces pombe]
MFKVDWDLGPVSKSASDQTKESRKEKKRKKGERKNVGDKGEKLNEKVLKKAKSVTTNNSLKSEIKKEKSVPSIKEKNKGDAKHTKLTSLQQKMKDKLDGANFRWINEQLYTTESDKAVQMFKENPDLFDIYHAGFRYQVEGWPENPVDIFIQHLKIRFEHSNAKKKNNIVIADLGCGEAKIASTFRKSRSLQVHSFDLVAPNEHVVACDIANVPMADETVDIAVFCLSLMGTNWQSFLKEAYRILKVGGLLWVAEIKSRFSDKSGEVFAKELPKLGFETKSIQLQNKMFTLFEFKKVPVHGKCEELPPILSACIYKRR